MGVAQGLVAVEFDVDVDEDAAACRAGLEVVEAVHARPVMRDAADAFDDFGIGAAVHERVPRALADAGCTKAQHGGGAKRHDRVDAAKAEAAGGPERQDGADIGQKVAQIVQPVRRDDAAAGAAGDAALPPDEAECQHDRDAHDGDAQPFIRQRHGFGREQASGRAPCDGACGDGDEDGLAQRGEVLGRGMAEGVILVGGLGGVEDGGHRAETDHEVHRAVGQRGRDRERAGLAEGPEFQPDKAAGHEDRGQTCGEVHADGGRSGHGRLRSRAAWCLAAR